MQYKVGDVVYIDEMVATTDHVDHYFVTVNIIDSMRKYVGKKAVIQQVTATGVYYLDIDNKTHHWTKEMLTTKFETPFQKWEKATGVNETCIA